MHGWRSVKALGTVFAIAFSLAMVEPGGVRAAPLRIRVDWTVVPGQFAPLIPEVPKYAPNVYRHYGQSTSSNRSKSRGAARH